MRIAIDTKVLARAALPTLGLGRELLLRSVENPQVFWYCPSSSSRKSVAFCVMRECVRYMV